MTRLILVSLLLTAVYSWEEIKHAVKVLIYGFLRRPRPLRYHGAHIDQFVGVLIMLAIVPISLTYFLASETNIWQKLGYVALALLAISAAAAGSGLMLRRLRYLHTYDGGTKIIPIVFSVAGLVTPAVRIFSGIDILPRKVLAKFAFLLSLPPLLGLVLKNSVAAAVPRPELLPNLNILIIVLTAALFARIAAEFLESHFRLYRLERLFPYFRVLIGILLAVALLGGPRA